MSSFDGFGRRGRPFDPDDIPWDQIANLIRLVLVGVIVVILLIVGMSTVYRIEASDEGVVLRFGKVLTYGKLASGEVVDTVPPGLHWKLPWPIERVYKVPVQRIQTLEFGFETERPGRVTRYATKNTDALDVAEMLTGDLNLGHVEWIVQYRVKSAMHYLFKLGSTEVIGSRAWSSGTRSEVNSAVPDTIRDVSESVMRKLVGDSSIDYVLILGREKLADAAKNAIQKELDIFEAGVKIVTVKLQTTSPPTQQVKDAFQEVNRARQKKERVVNEALGDRNSKLPAARGAKDQAIAEAEGYHNRVILETTGRINAFLAQATEYQKARDVTRQRIYLEAMEEILAAVGSKTIIDDSIRGVLPLLNLDQSESVPVMEKGTQR